MNNQPLISILIPTYNRQLMLKRALTSVINQTYKNLEILIADNCSDDNTQKICEEFAAKDSRIKYYKHEKNIGGCANTNFLYSIFKGEYAILLGDDDYLDLNFVDVCFNLAKENKDASVIYPSVTLYNQDSEFIEALNTVDMSQDDFIKRLRVFLNYNWKIFITQGLFNSQYIKEQIQIDGFYAKERFSDDTICMIKLLCAGRFISTEETRYHKTISTNNDCIQNAKNYWQDDSLSQKNFFSKISKNICEGLLNDNYFKKTLSANQRILACAIVKFNIFKWNYDLYMPTIGIYMKMIFQYIKRHPFNFLFKKEFHGLTKNITDFLKK